MDISKLFDGLTASEKEELLKLLKQEASKAISSTGITFDFKDGKGPVPAHQHSNGGGWIADTAYVAETAYVGPDATVSGKARVSENARVSGKAWVSENARVYGDATVSGGAWIYGNAQVCGDTWVYGMEIVKEGVRK